MSASLDEIVKYAQGAFIQAKSDGVLEAGEVVQIAVGVAGRLQSLGSQLSGVEKKSVVMYCLKKGMDAAGGVGELPGLKGASAETRKAVEDQLLAAAGAAIDMAVAVASGKLDLKKHGVKACIPLCFPLCLSAASVVQALLPKEAALVKQAVGWAEQQGRAYAEAQGVAEAPASVAVVAAVAAVVAPVAPVAPAAPAVAPAIPVPETPASIQESAAPAAPPSAPVESPAKETPPATPAETEPSPAASPEDAPVQTHEVRFE
jgi:hypothetical protein